MTNSIRNALYGIATVGALAGCSFAADRVKQQHDYAVADSAVERQFAHAKPIDTSYHLVLEGPGHDHSSIDRTRVALKIGAAITETCTFQAPMYDFPHPPPSNDVIGYERSIRPAADTTTFRAVELGDSASTKVCTAMVQDSYKLLLSRGIFGFRSGELWLK